MELLVIRHARPVRDEAPEGGSADPDLADVGRLQAEATADFLSEEGIDHIVASSMRRAVSTAEPLAGRLGLTVEILDDLRESDHRSRIYVPAEEFSRDDPATAHYYDPDADLNETIFSDGYEEFRARVERGFEQVIRTNRSRTVAVFCHGMVTGVYLQILLGIDDPLSLLVDYCGITRVAASSTGLRTVRSVNETHHVRHLLER
ncbi:MAG: histidine phosphatase family protein [Acidimicrobiaceae bacterium]|nr:histidine phosphatase family protein [Acidimicrobiaceae bacterium]MDE0515060.1 histidine phosphatase family protein [Acidimicrobiaceae bacterium]MXV99574.1 histidine phosphatase family protein [Acidimicrobiaceae bacterium]MXZ95184.1 histidine phosphatase family protein [Acidimicrobiaceae bacterium]MYA86557.1 histidine phosphatase family protein [Acidimicrobiaceae bacterium]